MKFPLVLIIAVLSCVSYAHAATYQSQRYSGKQTLPAMQSGDVFIACTFTGDLSAANFNNATIIACDFSNATLKSATFNNAVITSTVDSNVSSQVAAAKLQGVEGQTSFYNADLTGVTFNGAQIHAFFDNATLINASFQGAAIMLSSFNFADLTKTNFLSSASGHTSVILSSFICATGIDSMQVDLNSIMWQLKESLQNQSPDACNAMRTALEPCKGGQL